MSSRASVLVYGSPTKEFPIARGVRKGDPLSPFLFITAMEGLNVAMKNACSKSLFNAKKAPNNDPIVSHLFYVVVTLFIEDWENNCICNLTSFLKCFQVLSSLKVNFKKSKVFVFALQIGKFLDGRV